MYRLLVALLFTILLAPACTVTDDSGSLVPNGSDPDDTGLTPVSTIAAAFSNHESNIQVLQEGVITRVLSDDTDGDRHQRCIVRINNNQTLLIAHNIDLASRVPDLTTGEKLRFYGEYEWNDEGGVIHWTHRDPEGVHIDGWLEYRGKRYW